MPYPTSSQIHALFTLLRDPLNTDEFFTHVHPSVSWTVKGSCFLSGHWTTKASYRAATFDRLFTFLKPPGIKLEISEQSEQGQQGEQIQGIIFDEKTGWAAVELNTFDSWTKSGVHYQQTYAWHFRFDEQGLIVEVKIWTDTLTLQSVLGGEAVLQTGVVGDKKAAEEVSRGKDGKPVEE